RRRTFGRALADEEHTEAAGLANHHLAARRTRNVGYDRAFALRFAFTRLYVITLWITAPTRAADERPTELRAKPLDERLAALRAHLARLAAERLHLGVRFLERFVERPPEFIEHFAVLVFARFDLVEFVLEVTGELQVHDVREMLDEHIRDGLADFGCEEAALLLRHVAAFLNRGDDRGVRARPADAFLLERFHQRAFVEARRRLG